MENPETPVRILVVDDEPDIRNILHILLSSRGYEVDEAENGLRAVELVRTQPDYDLIILDIMMPGMDGVSACAEIRQHSVAPILFLTAKAQPADMSDAYGSGGDDYLIKPFSNHCSCGSTRSSAATASTTARVTRRRSLTRSRSTATRAPCAKTAAPSR